MRRTFGRPSYDYRTCRNSDREQIFAGRHWSLKGLLGGYFGLKVEWHVGFGFPREFDYNGDGCPS